MSSTRCRITAQTADQCSTGGRPHEGYRDLRRALRLAPSSVHKYSFPEHGRSPRVRGDLVRPARLRSHPHLIDPLHAAVHSGRNCPVRSSIPFHFTNVGILTVLSCPTMTIPAFIGCTAPSQ